MENCQLRFGLASVRKEHRALGAKIRINPATYGFRLHGFEEYKAIAGCVGKKWRKIRPPVIVNPTFMFGPYDSTPSSGAMIVALPFTKEGSRFYKGGRNYLQCKRCDCCQANAGNKGRIGECYILGNENLSYKEIFTKIANTVGVKPPSLAIPSFFAANCTDESVRWPGTSPATHQPSVIQLARFQQMNIITVLRKQRKERSSWNSCWNRNSWVVRMVKRKRYCAQHVVFKDKVAIITGSEWYRQSHCAWTIARRCEMV